MKAMPYMATDKIRNNYIGNSDFITEFIKKKIDVAPTPVG
jgi:hypothetical protein